MNKCDGHKEGVINYTKEDGLALCENFEILNTR
jgi:hypothetical protein